MRVRDLAMANLLHLEKVPSGFRYCARGQPISKKGVVYDFVGGEESLVDAVSRCVQNALNGFWRVLEPGQFR